MSVFERYAPFVQEYIYRHNWVDLRPIQVAAAEGIFKTDANLLLQAQTASGKTEAAFFPIITLLTEDRPKSVGCIYIGPLKALINDQFLRLTDLCREGDIAVWHWHGDVGQHHKDKLLRHPSGILQITPESLEALLLRKPQAVVNLFRDLRFVVIDEVHSLLQGDRGGQTICLIERLSRLANVNPRRIGLSATIGDPKRTGEFLSAGTGRQTLIPKIMVKGSRWRISMEHFYRGDDEDVPSEEDVAISQEPVEEDPNQIALDRPFGEAKATKTPTNLDPGIYYIFERTKRKKCLVFVNSREQCEAVTSTLRTYCEHFHEPDRYLIHHGNISASYRETAEALMRDETKFMTTVTTSTLELGIDIGRLERAFQVDAPWTVSSFLQRMGRTGRRGAPPEMWFMIQEDWPDPEDTLPALLPWKLIQAIALVQLYIEERWVEPPSLERLPYSLVYHQTMSILGAEGELSPKALASRILKMEYFHRVSQDDYRMLLNHLIATDHIQKTERGGLIIGLAGEKVLNSYKFYGVFKENEEFTVRDANEELGTIVYPPPVGEKIALAGHVWVVLDVDYKRHVVMCERVKGKVSAYFGQCPGELHTKVLLRMRQVLREDCSYPYVLPKASERLKGARETSAYTGINDRTLINLGGDMWCLFPWLGTYAFMALERFLKIHCAEKLGIKSFDSARPFFMQFTMEAQSKDFYRVLFEELAKPFTPQSLLYPREEPVFDKYDEYLPIQLVRKGFSESILDIKGMKARVEEWKDFATT